MKAELPNDYVKPGGGGGATQVREVQGQNENDNENVVYEMDQRQQMGGAELPSNAGRAELSS